jgi:Na+-driven multidrug efflux pump
VVLGAIFAAAVWFNVLTLVTLVGASGETAELAASYLRIIIPSLPILVASIVASAVLRSHGAAFSSMYVTILGGVVNAILDPIFVFALDMNLAGAAWASVAARIASTTLSFYFLFKNHGGLEAPDRVGLLRDFNPVMVITIPAILTQLATPVGAAFAIRAMTKFGEAAVAGMAVIGRLVPLGPIIGQNYGAGQMDRVKRTFYDALLFTGVVVVVIALALFLLRDPIAALFALEQRPALALLYAFCGPLAILFYFNGAIFVSNAAFNNLGHPYYSTWINWGRHTIGTIPFLYLGGMWFGPVGVLAGPYVGGVIFGLLGLALARSVMDQSQDSESEVQTHQAHQLRLFHLRR